MSKAQAQAQAQTGSRRQSARLQQREDSLPPSNPVHDVAITTVPKAKTSAANPKKRKVRADEDDDGFKFSRVKKKKPASSETTTAPASGKGNGIANTSSPEGPHNVPQSKSRNAVDASKRQTALLEALPTVQPQIADARHQDHDHIPPSKKKRRMSFSTPTKKDPPPIRRSKRLSSEIPAGRDDDASETAGPTQFQKPPKKKQTKQKPAEPAPPALAPSQSLPSPPTSKTRQQSSNPEEQPSDTNDGATKIALPFADTPVQSRNKAMRQGKSSKGERRSSLGLRGRRASSLIDQGNSTALPHSEVDPSDFYKHIESDLLEPRRMRQLLTWCLVRAMHPKSQGMNFEESSARSAARVIEEELSKDLVTNNELSNWFGRDDQPEGPTILPERPNPKNVANLAKIAELEKRLESLRMEKNSLLALMKPALPLEPVSYASVKTIDADTSPEDNSEISFLATVRSSASLPAQLSSRVNAVTTSLGPSIDTFADGLHKLNQSRRNTDQIAGQVLAFCADKLAQRQQIERNKTLGDVQEGSAARNLDSVLRGLSRTMQ